MIPRTYASPEAFKQALEQRLRTATTSGMAFARRRQMLVFDRFLARVSVVLGDAATLKGGLVLELRLARARTTKDVDLRLTGSSSHVLERLQAVARCDLGDFMTFEVVPDPEHPAIQNDGMQYEGMRFRAECALAGKLFLAAESGLGRPTLPPRPAGSAPPPADDDDDVLLRKMMGTAAKDAGPAPSAAPSAAPPPVDDEEELLRKMGVPPKK